MFEPNFSRDYANDTYNVSARCVFGCGTVTTATVPAPAVFQWRQGGHPQNVFPNLSRAQAEALFISGVCDSCFNNTVDEAIDSVFEDEEAHGEPVDGCVEEFGAHVDHRDCARMLDVMQNGYDYDPSYDYPEYDPQTSFYEATGRMQFPNEY
jgi:hypothetical protein